MKLALELEFPDDQAANVLRLLQSVPAVTVRILAHPASVSVGPAAPLGEEPARQLQQDRQDTPRDIAL